jgi:CRISPR-associated protein Csb2
MLRHAALAAAQRDGRDAAWIEQHVAGHGRSESAKSQRFSYLVLPGCEGEPGGAAVIQRAIVAGPPDAPREDVAWLQSSLLQALLWPERGPRPAARLCAADAGDAAFQRALAPAQLWASATPLVLPGRDDGKPGKAQRLVRKALAHAGFAPGAACEIELGRQPWIRTALDAREYFIPAHLRGLAVAHLRVRFAEPAAGPIALGAGRHVGLGVLTACA